MIELIRHLHRQKAPPPRFISGQVGWHGKLESQNSGLARLTDSKAMWRPTPWTHLNGEAGELVTGEFVVTVQRLQAAPARSYAPLAHFQAKVVRRGTGHRVGGWWLV